MRLFENWRKGYDFLAERRKAYNLVFRSIAGEEVLIDLAEFCHANKTCFDSDPRLHAVAEGRREVWLRIANHLNLTTEQLFALYTGQKFNPIQEKETADDE